MKFNIYRTPKYSEKNNIIELNCEGNGTENDPLIIDEFVPLPKSFEINDSEIFIHITNHTLSNLKISISKNITIDNCYIEWFELNSCAHIKISKASSVLMGIGMCNNCTLDGCIIWGTLSITNSSHNVIKNCDVHQRLIYNIFNQCRVNIFEGLDIPERDTDKILQDSSTGLDYSKNEQLFTIVESSQKIEGTGTGFKEDPFIFTPQEFSRQGFSLMESVHYVLIKNFNLRFIFLGRCKNKFIEDCKVRSIELKHCSNIRLDRTDLKTLRLGQCQDVTIDNCTIEILRLEKSFDEGVFIKDCLIRQIKGKNFDKLKLKYTEVQKIPKKVYNQ